MLCKITNEVNCSKLKYLICILCWSLQWAFRWDRQIRKSDTRREYQKQIVFAGMLPWHPYFQSRKSYTLWYSLVECNLSASVANQYKKRYQHAIFMQISICSIKYSIKLTIFCCIQCCLKIMLRVKLVDAARGEHLYTLWFLSSKLPNILH